MAEALSLHMENEEILKKSKNQLEMSNRQLVAEKELNQQLVQEKVAQARLHKKQIKELQVKSHPLYIPTLAFLAYHAPIDVHRSISAILSF